MRIKPILSLLVAGLMILSCIKHEVIPAPVPTVALKSKFTGTVIIGTSSAVAFNEGVDGYTCVSPNLKNTSPYTEIFYSKIYSTTNPATAPSVKIGFGTLSTAGDPTVDEFNAFFTSNTSPPYASFIPPNVLNGFEVSYTTATGTNYISVPTQTGQNVSFSSIVQESDASGDYSKFVCQFNCKLVYDLVSTPPTNAADDTMQITNGYFKGWFQR